MEMCSKLKDLIHYKRSGEVNIKDYISEFDARYQRAIAKKSQSFLTNSSCGCC